MESRIRALSLHFTFHVSYVADPDMWNAIQGSKTFKQIKNKKYYLLDVHEDLPYAKSLALQRKYPGLETWFDVL
jgi:hypothetical protein